MTRTAAEGITVVVPVYNAAAALVECVASLQRTLPATARALLIDDASPDAAVAEVLAAIPAEDERFRVWHNRQNMGFVATCNHGMAVAAGDVVLLNQDTVVTAGWLQALARCAASAPDVATATPLTNNGEIASFPAFCQPNPWPEDPEHVAAACRRAGPPEYPELPTAVGFCMYITRNALDRLGGFDPAFGQGYGEENDFSRRAVAAGMRNLLCDDAYVAHCGGASFSEIGLAPGGEAMQRVLDRHPDYLEVVRDFIRRDPLAPVRARIAAALEQWQ